MGNKITLEDTAEFIGQLIDCFEDFLDRKGVVIENHQRNVDIIEALAAGCNPDFANIYQNDYDELYDQIYDTLKNWEVIKECEPDAE